MKFSKFYFRGAQGFRWASGGLKGIRSIKGKGGASKENKKGKGRDRPFLSIQSGKGDQ
jgi:hypothetical protein